MTKYKPKRLSRLVEIRRDTRSGAVARTVQKSVEALMRSREIVARSKSLLNEIRESRLHRDNATG